MTPTTRVRERERARNGHIERGRESERQTGRQKVSQTDRLTK